MRGLRWRMRKLPKPRISILSPERSAPMTESKMVSTMVSLSRRVRSPSFVTSSTRSAFVMVGLAPIWVGPLFTIVDAICLACKVNYLRDFGWEGRAACPGRKPGLGRIPVWPWLPPEEVEAGAPVEQFGGLVDQVIGIRDQVPDASVVDLWLDSAGLAEDAD